MKRLLHSWWALVAGSVKSEKALTQLVGSSGGSVKSERALKVGGR